MKVRRSAYIVVTWNDIAGDGEASAYSPLTGDRTALSRAELGELLTIPVEGFAERGDEWARSLCRSGVLLSDSSDARSEELRRREQALSTLGWDPDAVYFHLASRWEGVRSVFLTELKGVEAPVFGGPGRALEIVPLPRAAGDSELYELLLERRTHREFRPARSMSVEQLSLVLGYVWGAHGSRLDSRGAPVVTKTSPSGGSLHPIEVYPIVADVGGVSPGIYHYAVRTHALELLEPIAADAVAPVIDEFVAGQAWFASAQVVFLMTARFERSFAKYRRHARAYTALFLDAGHLSQTFYLVCTKLELGPFVTAAINGADIENRLGLDPYVEGALCICGCARVDGRSASDVVTPYPFLSG